MDPGEREGASRLSASEVEQRIAKKRIKTLIDLGFLRVAPLGNKKCGLIFVVDPHRVVKKLRADGLVPDNWWGAYNKRASEIKYVLP